MSVPPVMVLDVVLAAMVCGPADLSAEGLHAVGDLVNFSSELNCGQLGDEVHVVNRARGILVLELSDQQPQEGIAARACSRLATPWESLSPRWTTLARR